MELVSELKKEIVTVAKKYNGLKEIPGNQGFYDKAFEQRSKQAGFQKGFAWCMIACEVFLIEAIENIEKKYGKDLTKLKNEVKTEITPSTIGTWNNFKESVSFLRLTANPLPGDIVIWVNTASRGTGHAGIVIGVLSNGSFQTIEGNTNNDGSREGNQIAIKSRLVERDGKGLDVLGFIRIKEGVI
jgi:hypothetical protein